MSINIVVVAGSAVGTVTIVGILIRVWYNACSVAGREKRNKRDEFRGSLVEFKSRVDAHDQLLHVIAENWSHMRHTFIGNADEVRSAIPWLKKRVFDKAVASVSAIRPVDVDQTEVNEKGERILVGTIKLSKALGDVIKLLR